MSQTELNTQFAAAEVAITGRRLCGGCQISRSIENGKYVRTANGAKRWVCGPCIAKKKAPKR